MMGFCWYSDRREERPTHYHGRYSKWFLKEERFEERKSRQQVMVISNDVFGERQTEQPAMNPCKMTFWK